MKHWSTHTHQKTNERWIIHGKWRIRGSAFPSLFPIKQRALLKQTNKQNSISSNILYLLMTYVAFSRRQKRKAEFAKMRKLLPVQFARQHFPKTPKSNTNGSHNNIFGSFGGQVCVVMLQRSLQWPYPSHKSEKPRTFNMGTRWELMGQGPR